MKPLQFFRCSGILLGLALLPGCTSKKSSPEQPIQAQPATNVEYAVSEDKASLAAYYQLDHIKEWYPERVLPPAFDYQVDLTNKSIVELSLLRNEIFARNGYLFDDAVLRGHFNQYPWYQPIFDVPEFQVRLNKEEQEFVNKVLTLENELFENRYAKNGNYEMIGMDHVYNLIQFKTIDNNLRASLATNNFAIVQAAHEQLFHVYDNNHYQYIPNFITTDLYLQVLHKHFSTTLQKIEEDKFIPLLTGLLENLHKASVEFEKKEGDEQLKRAAEFTSNYLKIAHSLIITNEIREISNNVVESELQKIFSAEGVGSKFLRANYIQYSQFTPRGNYTRSEELENYFRCVKWLNTAPILIEDNERFLSAILIASFIRNSPESLSSFQRYNDAIKFIVGEEDNLSIGNLVDLISTSEAANPASLNNAASLDLFRKKLTGLGVDRIKPKGGDEFAEQELRQKSVLFTAGRYTFDAEILSRLIHVLQPKPLRPFPKGLDVFASLGNSAANKILMEEYEEQKKWPAFPDTLAFIKAKFSQYDEWDKNIYTKTFEAIAHLNTTDTDVPLFMKTPAWSKKELSTSLAAWTELKHDMLLYTEQPYAAQAGQGGGPPPPQHISYVEPNVAFWEKSLALLDFQEKQLARMELTNDATKEIIEDLRDIASTLLTISKKELANEKITPEEFQYLTYLGGRIEYLTFRIFGSDHLPEKERLVAVVADVYYNDGVYLEEAVGMADEIYVVAEINGKPYLTKGAVFSYYEFTNHSPLTDEDWRAQITSGDVPDRPVWMTEIIVNSPSLESKPTYSF